MPTYEYACSSCGHHLEVSQSFSDEPLTTCPNCGGNLRKVFGSIGIVLKGSGFYRTDSRAAAANGKAPKKEKEAASAPATDSSGSSAAGGAASPSGSGSASASSASSGSGASPGSPTSAAAG